MRARPELVVALALLLCAVGASALRARATDDFLASQTYEDVYYLPPPEWLGVFSLGHRHALADLIWTRALVYFGDEMIARGDLTHAFDYAEAMLFLDPDFLAVYRWVGTAGVYHPTESDPDDMDRAVSIMERGLERFPDDGRLAWQIGSTLAFEIAPILGDEPERAAAARRRGAEFMMTAARLGAAPDWLVLTNTSILSELGEMDAAARHLEEMYSIVQDESVRARIAERLGDVRSAIQTEAFLAAAEHLEEQRLFQYPFVHPDMVILLGEQPRPYELLEDGYADAVLEDDVQFEDDALFDATHSEAP